MVSIPAAENRKHIKKAKHGRTVKLLKRYRYIYLMVFPAIAVIFIFYYVPLFGWFIAFQNYSPMTSFWNSPWAGLAHFKRFFLMVSDYAYTIRNTLVMNFGNFLVPLTASFILALLINEVGIKPLSKTVQIVSLFPYFVSWTIVYALIYAFFAQSSGAVNQVLMDLGLIKSPINLLGSPKYSWMMMILATTWKMIGYNSILFIAAIASVEREMLEAAVIDGAGRFARVRHIIIPHLLPTLMILFIINSGAVFNSDLGVFMLFTNPTNWETMTVLDYYIYSFGIKQGNYSYATAVGIIKSALSIAMVFLTNWLSKRITEKSIF